jgi:hypothetical protein
MPEIIPTVNKTPIPFLSLYPRIMNFKSSSELPLFLTNSEILSINTSIPKISFPEVSTIE